MNYIGLDGDSIGRFIESLLIENNIDGLKEFTESITTALQRIENQVEKDDGKVIFSGGDSILFYGNFDLDYAKNILIQFNSDTGRTASVGIGDTPSDTYLGLKLAKARGGNKAIDYNEEIKK